MTTLLLDADSWDLVLDINGNIAVAADPYATVQDCASAMRLMQGELWYNTTAGVPYAEILGVYPPNIALIKTLLAQACLSVPNVASATIVITSIIDRIVFGQAQIVTKSGLRVTVPIPGLAPST